MNYTCVHYITSPYNSNPTIPHLSPTILHHIPTTTTIITIISLYAKQPKKTNTKTKKWEKYTDLSHAQEKSRDRPPRLKNRRTRKSSPAVVPRSACSTTVVMSMLSLGWGVRRLDPIPMLTRCNGMESDLILYY